MKLTARLFQESDVPTRVAWINNPVINNTMFFDLPATEEKTVNWFRGKDNNKRVDFSFLDESGVIVCMGGYTDISRIHDNAEFYVMVNPDYQGKGIGKKASFWMYNYAFLELELNKIYLYTNQDNIAAYKIYEKAGFTLEGILRQHKFKNNTFIDRRFYGLLKSDWIEKDWRIESITYEF